jgi:hypothetical protein
MSLLFGGEVGLVMLGTRVAQSACSANTPKSFLLPEQFYLDLIRKETPTLPDMFGTGIKLASARSGIH